MIYFLEHIARSLHDEFGNTLNRHCLVFPNRRAGLYFLKYLAANIKKPVWAPSVYTINELFRSYSSLQIPGNEILLFELYKVYRHLKKAPESFDDFYFWGDILLNDFDDIDKYLVDASILFRNVQDIKNIDQQFGGLTEAQIEIIKRFWTNFNPDKPTNEKSEFTSIWSVLSNLYTGFRTSIKEQNFAYEGMIFREIAENYKLDFIEGTRWDMVHFIGFNALNDCEKIIMTRFKNAGKARFYWDYDNSYIDESKPNSAGFFLKNNLRIFGNDMPSGWSYDTLLSAGVPRVKRRIIDTSSDVAQVKLISWIVGELPDLTGANAHHTAVVLADENLLIPALTSLPENTGDINITMGYPLKQTLVYTLIKSLMDLQRNSVITDGTVRFGHSDVITILKHTLISGLMSESDNDIIKSITKNNLTWVASDLFAGSEYLVAIFRKHLTPQLLSEYYKDVFSMVAANDKNFSAETDKNNVQSNIRNEFIYRVVLSINRLETILNSQEVSFSAETYNRILDRMLRAQSVPFSGEPLSGIQIMGILETRALDFKNLIILSVNEGILPAISAGSSFIPFSLREAFGLPSVNHQESIYAYHFYRLLHRAENVTFIYNSNSEGLRSGEMSRFLIQMNYDTQLRPDTIDLSFEIKTPGTIEEKLEKTEEHLFQLTSQFSGKNKERVLSPSAINTWLNCRMKFYYRYVNRLKEPEKISEDIDPAMMGNILHEIMKQLYSRFIGNLVTAEAVNSILNDSRKLEGIIDKVINEKFNSRQINKIDGNELIVRDVLKAYLQRILEADFNIAPFLILNLEDSFSFPLPLSVNGSEIEIMTGGKVDRIDVLNGVTRIVDYKTGTVSDSISSISDLFTDERKKESDGWLQTLLYCEAFLAKNPETVIRPSLYKIKKMSGGINVDKLCIKTDSRNEIMLEDYKSVRNEFICGIEGTIAKIFSKEEPFLMTSDTRGKCSYCSYKALCMR